MSERVDHDLLTEIATKLTLFIDMFNKHTQDDAAAISILSRDIKAAHKRMDFITLSGIFTIILFIVTIWIKLK